MPVYQVTFRISPVSDEQEDALLDAIDDAFIGGHGEVTLITVLAAGADGVTAADGVTRVLASLGVAVKHIEPDLVTAAAIADRAGVTRQAVGHWTRRRSQPPFPTPAVLTGGQLWRWQEVNDWFRSTGRAYDDVQFLTRAEEACIDSRLVIRVRAGKVAEAPIRWTPVSSVKEARHTLQSVVPLSKFEYLLQHLSRREVVLHLEAGTLAPLERLETGFHEIGFDLELSEESYTEIAESSR